MSIGSVTHPAQLAVLDLETMTPTVVAAFDSLGAGRFRWVNDKRLVFDLATHREARREIRQAPGLFAVDADGENFRQLVQTTAAWLKAPPAGASRCPGTCSCSTAWAAGRARGVRRLAQTVRR